MLVRTPDVGLDNRVRREAESVAKLGHRVVVLTEGTSAVPAPANGVEYVRLEQPTGVQRRRARVAERTEGYRRRRSLLTRVRLGWAMATLRVLETGRRVNRSSPVRSATKWWRLNPSLLRIRFWKLARPALRELRPDVVHAHDLKTLYAGARYRAARLIYDAHEYETQSIAIRSARQRLGARVFERYGIRRAAAVITVSDGIADELAELYGIPKPYVVLNTPHAGIADRPIAPPLRERAGVVPGDVLLAYVGRVHPARGTSLLVEALATLDPRFHLAIVGMRASRADDALLAEARAAGVADRVHLLPPVPGDDVPALLRGADVVVLPGAPSCRSYELAMPNKLFEAVQAGVAIAVSDRRPSMAAFVAAHGLGAAYDVLDPSSLARAIEAAQAARPDPQELADLQRRYSWEAQELVLADVYRAVIAE